MNNQLIPCLMDELVWLDLRSPEVYQSGHYVHSINLQWTMLQSCLNALPSRTTSLGIIAPLALQQTVTQHLIEKGYQVTLSLQPDQLLQPGLVIVSGQNSFQAWQPNSLLRIQLADLKPDRKQALDLGCGGGRDAVYLAQQGWNVTAIDQQQRVLQCAQQLADLHQVQVNWIEADLRDTNALPSASFDLIMMVRFLERDLFSYMRQHCRPGGYVMIQTFVEGVEVFGSPKNPNYILRFGELAKEFNEFDVIVDKIDALSDGRPVASFLARRKQGETP